MLLKHHKNINFCQNRHCNKWKMCYNLVKPKERKGAVESQETEQLEQLYRQMYELLFGYANAALKDPSRSEEAVQETFRIACDKCADLLKSRNPRGWLVNTLKGVLRNMRRKDARYSRVFVPLTEHCNGEQTQELPPELLYQDLAKTREYELMVKLSESGSVKELAQRLGISENACKKRIQRSRRFLRKRIAK